MREVGGEGRHFNRLTRVLLCCFVLTQLTSLTLHFPHSSRCLQVSAQVCCEARQGAAQAAGGASAGGSEGVRE